MSGEGEFSDMYQSGYARLVAELTLLTGSRATAEDAVQEAYARAWGRWTVVSQYDEPIAWVRRVAHNLAISRWRRLRVAARFRASVATADSVDGPGPEWTDLRTALLKLPLAQRRALVLTAVEGLTADEVAIDMGVSPATVRSWLHRARTRVNPAEDTHVPPVSSRRTP